MKKIIAVILVGFSIMTCFTACGEEEEVVGIDRQTANSMVDAGEDCGFSSDGKTFYINEDRDRDGEVDTIVGYKVID